MVREAEAGGEETWGFIPVRWAQLVAAGWVSTYLLVLFVQLQPQKSPHSQDLSMHWEDAGHLQKSRFSRSEHSDAQPCFFNVARNHQSVHCALINLKDYTVFKGNLQQRKSSHMAEIKQKAKERLEYMCQENSEMNISKDSCLRRGILNCTVCCKTCTGRQT